MMKQLLKINLQLFDGAAGAAAAGAPGDAGVNTGVLPQDAAGDVAETTEPEVIYGKPPEEIDPNHPANGEIEPEVAEKTVKEREAEFDKLIKGEYKDLFDGRVKNIIQRRLPDVKALESQVQSHQDIFALMGAKYGVDAADTAALQKAIEEDDSYWEDAAENEGLTVDQYKKLKKMEAENAALKRAQIEAEQNTQKEQVFAKWESEAQAIKNFYPRFDLETELQNEQFLRLLGAGIDMRTSYETIHHDDILTGAMSYTAKEVARRQADAIKAGTLRPVENGISARAPVTVKRDPNSLTAADMREIAKRVRAGETISF